MSEYKVIEIKQSIFADNDKDAEILREELKEKGTFLLNLMSSPGAGKTNNREGSGDLLVFCLRLDMFLPMVLQVFWQMELERCKIFLWDEEQELLS